MNTHVHYRLENGAAILQLNNGKVNALSPAVITALNQALDQAEQDKAVVVLTGQPGMLSGGYDLKVMMAGPQQALDLVASGSALTRRMLAHPFPLIVACSG
ncbi:MAG: enoyl-CoA hydratase-related protein, partial [Thiopseudomonas sp.]